MANTSKISKTAVDSSLRRDIFTNYLDMEQFPVFQKINERTFGGLFTDVNGTQRYVRLGLVVAEEREDMTAAELMNAEIAAYEATQAKKAERAAARAEKAAKDKAKREEAARKAAKEKAETK